MTHMRWKGKTTQQGTHTDDTTHRSEYATEAQYLRVLARCVDNVEVVNRRVEPHAPGRLGEGVGRRTYKERTHKRG